MQVDFRPVRAHVFEGMFLAPRYVQVAVYARQDGTWGFKRSPFSFDEAKIKWGTFEEVLSALTALRGAGAAVALELPDKRVELQQHADNWFRSAEDMAAFATRCGLKVEIVGGEHTLRHERFHVVRKWEILRTAWDRKGCITWVGRLYLRSSNYVPVISQGSFERFLRDLSNTLVVTEANLAAHRKELEQEIAKLDAQVLEWQSLGQTLQEQMS